MSRSADPRAPRDAGFTLLEVIVALGITTVVMVAMLPQLVAGIRSTGTANAVTLSKGVAQAELELMRNLPFHVAPSAGAHVDVLDRYYPDLAPPTSAPACAAPASASAASWTGYVAAGSSARCSFEPASGAFYRTVRSVDSERGSLVVVIATQFLSAAVPPAAVTPRAGYDTGTDGRHLPASSQIGVTATVVHRDQGKVRPVTTYTQIADQPRAPRRILAEATATALHVGSVTADGRALSLSAGLVNVAGTVSTVSTVTGNATAVTGGLGTGEQEDGASRTVQSPPTQAIAPTSAPAGGLPGFGCSYACWGPSQLGAASVSAEGGLPRAGSSGAPIQAGVTDASTNSGVQFGTATTATDYRPGLGLTGPLVRLDEAAVPYPSQLAGCAVTPTGVLTASGYLQSADDATARNVESCAVTRSAPIVLLPTEFAPQGVIRVRLEQASARCTASAASGTATHDFRAVVEVWNGSEYVVVAEPVAGQTTDPLAAVPMTTDVGGGHTLTDYLAAWSSATSGTVRSEQAAGRAEVSVPGVVTIATQPVRSGAADGLDPASAVALTIGAVSCSTEDAR
ncbi:hypothetical protein DDE18_16135 [Nocardioides gansuensis]|uniref:Uncharacterized protein n=1 Tax=Nocardioides gansuensis TaxID=2138300 RepID=A0A2T8F754_9ACTN|nr:prepilin-type N-terminal cleavage/methylation domain-containing protein [Nocardioides gansuensis]PVG81540.1 hypothetical protein DDE18_16135 [Nocardioides gansuensis]